MKHFTGVVVLALALLPYTGLQQRLAQASSGMQSGLDADETTTMALVLEAAYVHAAPGWVLVGARTATFQCNPPADIGFTIGGCSGMRLPAESSQERLAMVRKELPEVSVDMSADLLAKSQATVAISRPLPARVEQVLWAPGNAYGLKPTGNPTFAAYFSRVGFDRLRLKALLYLGTVNWTDQSKSVGQYLYLQKSKGAWTIKAHAKVWDQTNITPSNQRLHPTAAGTDAERPRVNRSRWADEYRTARNPRWQERAVSSPMPVGIEAGGGTMGRHPKCALSLADVINKRDRGALLYAAASAVCLHPADLIHAPRH